MSTAILGGTFDPIHSGHVEIARAAADRFGLEKVLFIPSGRPPHKRPPNEADFENRFQMVALACKADPRFQPSRLEEPRDAAGPHYSFHTINKVVENLVPGEKLFFIIGTDAFSEIKLWYRWQEVARAVEFIVVSRPGSDVTEDAVPAEAKVHWLRSVHIPVSSTEIRERLHADQAVNDWLLPEVAQYVEEHGLYRATRG